MGKLNRIIIASFFLHLGAVAYAEDTTAKVKCLDWSLSETFDWAGCHWSETGGWQDQAKESALKSLQSAAKDKLKAVALKVIADQIPFAGTLSSMFGDKPEQPSEIQVAVNTILDSIKVSQEHTLLEINKILIARDFADLKAFKLRVSSYMLYSEAVRKNNLNELQNLWNTSVALRNLFETHTNLLGPAETVDSLHAYLSIVSLELILRTQLTVYNYSIVGQPELINSKLIEHFQNELLEVFIQMDNIDWVKGAESLRVEKSFSQQVRAKSGCIFWNYRKFEYLGQPFSIKTDCGIADSVSTATCTTTFPDASAKFFLSYGYVATSYSYTSKLAGSLCNAVNSPVFDETSPYSQKNILKAIAAQDAKKMVADVYKPSSTILDQWWSMAGFAGQRPTNIADQWLRNPVVIPPAPTNVFAGYTGCPYMSCQNYIGWNPSAGAIYYYWRPTDTSGATLVTQTGFTAASTLQSSVQACNTAGCSAWSYAQKR